MTLETTKSSWTSRNHVCVRTRVYSQFLPFWFKVILANTVTFLSVSFPVMFHPLLPFTVYFLLPSSTISPFLISSTSDSGTLVGSQRLQQIINPADPLEIQADVHWTHIREKEEEERMVPTSESSTSRGNCFKIQGPDMPLRAALSLLPLSLLQRTLLVGPKP